MFRNYINKKIIILKINNFQHWKIYQFSVPIKYKCKQVEIKRINFHKLKANYKFKLKEIL